MDNKDIIIIDIKNIDTKAIEKTANFIQYKAFEYLTKSLKADIG